MSVVCDSIQVFQCFEEVGSSCNVGIMIQAAIELEPSKVENRFNVCWIEFKHSRMKGKRKLRFENDEKETVSTSVGSVTNLLKAASACDICSSSA